MTRIELPQRRIVLRWSAGSGALAAPSERLPSPRCAPGTSCRSQTQQPTIPTHRHASPGSLLRRGQMEVLGGRLHERGYNVRIPRMPHNGVADLLTRHLKRPQRR